MGQIEQTGLALMNRMHAATTVGVSTRETQRSPDDIVGHQAGQALKRLKGLDEVVVLGGSLGRIATVREGLGRHLYELPASEGETILERWCRRTSEAFAELGVATPVVRVLRDAMSPNVRSLRQSTVICQDTSEIAPTRGTAGVLRDWWEVTKPEAVLAVGASDLLHPPSAHLLRSMLTSSADYVLVADESGRPWGPMLLSGEVLARVPTVGFHDLKEQVLPRLAPRHRVEVLREERREQGSLRTRDDYLDFIASLDDHSVESRDAFDERLVGRAIVEAATTATVEGVISDSVLLDGCAVTGASVVVRCVIGPGVHVGRGEHLVDQTLVRGRRGYRTVAW